jgi:hypothetical protein
MQVVPHKEHLTGIEETRQLEKAGVSKADIVGAFHLPLKRSGGRFDVTERVRRESGAHDFQLRNSVKNTGTRGVFGESFGGKGEHHASVTDMRAEAKVQIPRLHTFFLYLRDCSDTILNLCFSCQEIHFLVVKMTHCVNHPSILARLATV